MKTTVSNASSFAPVSLTITFESKRELDGFAALFNHSDVCAAVREVAGFDPHAEICEPLQANGAKVYPAFDGIKAKFRQP